MAERIVVDCDRCGKPTGTRVSPLTLIVDTYLDAAGSTDTDQRSFDLCPACCRLEMQRFLGKLSRLDAQRFCERVTRQPFRDWKGRVVILPKE